MKPAVVVLMLSLALVAMPVADAATAAVEAGAEVPAGCFPDLGAVAVCGLCLRVFGWLICVI